MEVVLLIQLSLDLAIDSQAEKVRILLPGRRGRINLTLVQDVVESADGLGGDVHLSVDRVLKVAGQILDLLDLLLKIAPEPGKGEDDVFLNLLGLVGLVDGVLVVGAQKLQGVVDAGRPEKVGRAGNVVGDVGELDERLGPMLVVALNLAEVGNEVLEDLAPGCVGPHG